MSEVWSQTHKSPLKTHTEALKIQNFLGGDPLTPLTRGRVTLSCSPPLVPSALDDFLRRTTFKYAATALPQTLNNNKKKQKKKQSAWCIRLVPRGPEFDPLLHVSVTVSDETLSCGHTKVTHNNKHSQLNYTGTATEQP